MMSTTLSICIPTYNRAAHLVNCLESIRSATARSGMPVQVCVSDNCSTDDTAQVVAAAQQGMAITYYRNPVNTGRPRNYLNVVGLAEGEFVWLIGDDDLVMPEALEALATLFEQHQATDFFYVNAFHLTTEYVASFPPPFKTTDLPAGMRAFSPHRVDGAMTFFDLIDPGISFDFLGGMFLSVFRRRPWMAHTSALGDAAFDDRAMFSNFDNTFPHVKIFAEAFGQSPAFFHARPLIVCLTGAREWAPMYPMVRSVRLVEALGQYRRNGLPLGRYLRCKNYALGNFVPDLVYMRLHRATSGYAYIKPLRLILSNCWYPNFYLSVVYYCVRRMQALARAFASGHRAPAVVPKPGGTSLP